MYDNRLGRGSGPYSSQSYGRGGLQSSGLGPMSGPPLSAGRAENISSLGQQSMAGNVGARVPVGSSNPAPSSYCPGGPNLASRAIVPPPGAEPAPYLGPSMHQYMPSGIPGNSGARVPVGSNQGSSSAPSPLQPPPGYVRSPYGSRTSGWES